MTLLISLDILLLSIMFIAVVSSISTFATSFFLKLKTSQIIIVITIIQTSNPFPE